MSKMLLSAITSLFYVEKRIFNPQFNLAGGSSPPEQCWRLAGMMDVHTNLLGLDSLVVCIMHKYYLFGWMRCGGGWECSKHLMSH